MLSETLVNDNSTDLFVFVVVVVVVVVVFVVSLSFIKRNVLNVLINFMRLYINSSKQIKDLFVAS